MHWLLDQRPVPFDQVPPGQAVAEESPEDGQYEATGHSSHAVIPAFDWYLPATHESHTEAPGEALAVPRLQSRHAFALVAPLIGWYLPTSHALQPVLVLSPTRSDHVPGSHWTKADAESAPTSSQYPPALHSSHAVLPWEAAYVPAGQATHPK